MARGYEAALPVSTRFLLTTPTGQFVVGDLEIADEELAHTLAAGPGEACVCLAATDAPLRFRSLMPRLLQPLFKI